MILCHKICYLIAVSHLASAERPVTLISTSKDIKDIVLTLDVAELRSACTHLSSVTLIQP